MKNNDDPTRPNSAASLVKISAFDAKINALLMRIGFYPSSNGTTYARLAIKLYPHYSFMRVYDELARLYSTTPAIIERDMRNAIVSAGRRGWLNRLNDVLGVQVVTDNHLTAKQLIATICEYFRFHSDDKKAE